MCIPSRNQEDGWMKLLACKVHVQGMAVLLADKVHERNHNINGYISHNHLYISSCDITVIPCELC